MNTRVNRGVGAAADKAREDAEHAADQRCDHHRDDTHQKRHSAAIDEAGKHVAAQLVGAERMAAPAE
jgi:hypothetical protein